MCKKRGQATRAHSSAEYHALKDMVSWSIRDLLGGREQGSNLGHWLYIGFIWETNDSNNKKTSNKILMTGCHPPEIVI